MAKEKESETSNSVKGAIIAVTAAVLFFAVVVFIGVYKESKLHKNIKK
jgi:hypothetical protein